jgi:hypothetical protein
VENNIPESILRSIFKSEDIDIVDAEHQTNISDLHVPNKPTPTSSKNIETTFESSGLVDLDRINITEKEMMSSAISNLNAQKYLSYTHGSYPINEYNNPHLITCMFPSLFPYGTGAPELQNRTIKISLESHIQYLLNLEDENHKFSTHHLFRFFMFNLKQRRQICRGAKLTISRSSFIKESQILNNIRSKDFKDAIKNPTSAFENPGIGNLVRQLKATSRHVMASGSSRVVQREEIFNMINYFGTPTLFFTINPAVVHHPCISLLCGKEINLDIFYDNNLPNSRDCSILAAMNPKAQVQFVQALVHATYTYLFCAKTTFNKENNDCGILGNVQTY